MRFLLDTNAVIWALSEPHRLNQSLWQLIGDRQNTVLISTATYWEIAIKLAKGSLPQMSQSIIQISNEAARPKI